MGYETELLIGKDTGQSFGDEGTYFQIYAHVDMCKMGNSSLFDLPWVNNTPEKNKWYFYPVCGDGETMVTEDCYGELLRPVPITDAIHALEKDIDNNDYRRFKWALALLKTMQEDSPEGLSVLMYGY